MRTSEITFNEISNLINNLSIDEFKNIVNNYSKINKVDFQFKTNISSLEDRLTELNVNSCCPHCHSSIINKKGKNSKGYQRFKCCECNTIFTRFTGTILDKTNYSYNVWIKLLEMIINDYSIENMVEVFKNDFNLPLDSKTIWALRMKLIHSIASLPKPKLTGVIQIDETFVREAQKGSRNLKSYIANEERVARYGKVPSKYGIMGAEFATITTAIDNNGYSVSLVTGLGKLTSEIFFDMFSDYIVSPTYICTDANNVYNKYCEINAVPHYIKPSNYDDILEKNNYYNLSNEEKEKLLLKLYNKDLIDKMDNRGDLSYLEFKEIKEHNKLSLSRVNQLHSDIKFFIYKKMTNVSTKYLQDYIGFFDYIRNYKVRYGNYPASKKDIEIIFNEILANKVNYTIKDITSKELDIPKPTGRYMQILKEETENIRKETYNIYFKFNEEDNAISFNKREYLLNIPKYKLYNLCKEYNIKKYKKLATWCIVTKLLTLPNIDKIIHNLILQDRNIKINFEDL